MDEDRKALAEALGDALSRGKINGVGSIFGMKIIYEDNSKIDKKLSFIQEKIRKGIKYEKKAK